MSDVDPELPDFLVEAILAQGPPAEAVELVKDAFTWRTIDAELMELSYDSVLDTAGVRDATARRTLEFTIGDVSIVVEVDGQLLTGHVTGFAANSVELRGLSGSQSAAVTDTGSFVFEAAGSGASLLLVSADDDSIQTPVFTID